MKTSLRSNLIVALTLVTGPAFAQWSVAPTTLSQMRSEHAAAGVGNLAIFAGGIHAGGMSAVVDVIDAVTGTATVSALPSGPRHRLAATTAAGRGVFAGGLAPGGPSAAVDVYTPGGGPWSSTTLSLARSDLAAAATGNLVFFGGGAVDVAGNTTARVDVLDVSNMQWQPSLSLSVARSHLAAASVGTKVFFAGGQTSPGVYSAVVDVYDTATASWSQTSLSRARADLGAARAGTKLLFAGGWDGADLTEVDRYDDTNGTWSTASLACASHRHVGAGAGSVALFYDQSGRIDAYDDSNGEWWSTSLHDPRPGAAATAAAGRILFAGDANANFDTVEVYDPALQGGCPERVLGPYSSAGRSLGEAVAMRGDVAAVGGWAGSHPCSPNGPVSEEGVVHVYRRSGAAWTFEQDLVASNVQAYQYFGDAVAFNATGDALAVGAPGDTGETGAVFIFEWNGASWIESGYLVDSNGSPGDQLGLQVAFDGGTVVAGSPDPQGGAGVAVVFEEPAGGWASSPAAPMTETRRLAPSQPGNKPAFGSSVAIDGETVVVGAESWGKGRAFVFERPVGGWSVGGPAALNESGVLGAADPSLASCLGQSVAIDGDRVLVSDHFGEHQGLGSEVGAVHAYERPNGGWSGTPQAPLTEVQRFHPATPVADMLFGVHLTMEAGVAVVGAPGPLSFLAGTGGPGTAHVFNLAAGGWSECATPLTACDGAEDDGFGVHVAQSGEEVLVGALWKDEHGLDSGAAYFLEVGVTIGTAYCQPAVANSTGQPGAISAQGSLLVVENCFQLRAELLPPHEYGYFITSQTQGFVVGPGGSQGNLCLGGAIGRFNAQVQNSGAAGVIWIPVDLGAVPTPGGTVAVQPGQTWNFQLWYRDKNPGTTSNFTEGLTSTFQ